MSKSHTTRPRIYFSFRSPYSWLAYRDLVTLHPRVVRVAEWRPFWEPDTISERLLTEAGGRFPYTQMSREKHLYILRDVKRMAMQRGLSMTWPVDRTAWWEPSHLGYLAAEKLGRGLDFLRVVYRARWEDGRDISDRNVIGQLASETGLPAAIADAADNREIRQCGTRALLRVDEDSVFGVPMFIHKREPFWGVDRLAMFAESLDRPSSDLSGDDTVPLDEPKATDWGHAGGCG